MEHISIHALREEGDSVHSAKGWTTSKFQSTPSARRATIGIGRVVTFFTNFNPRPPRGERQLQSMPRARSTGFQSTPSARRATDASCNGVWLVLFQSTPSVGRATGQAQDPGIRQAISIRNLHMEGDYRQADCLRRGIHDFNPRPPRGGRLFDVMTQQGTVEISIHALREEGDGRAGEPLRLLDNFNPRPPRGERRHFRRGHRERSAISIHALREESDIRMCWIFCPRWYFNPRPPRGGRQQKRRKNPPRLFHYTHLCTI